jgi:hypothetical protein
MMADIIILPLFYVLIYRMWLGSHWNLWKLTIMKRGATCPIYVVQFDQYKKSLWKLQLKFYCAIIGKGFT